MYVLGAVVERIRYGDSPVRMTKAQRAEAQLKADLLRSQSYMRSIVQGLIMYASNNNQTFPPISDWQTALVNGSYIDPDVLSSPVRDGGEYTLIAMPAELDAEKLVLYEDPNNHASGVNVVFADAHVEQLAHDEFQRLLAEQFSNATP